jgi:hypothetical protein
VRVKYLYVECGLILCSSFCISVIMEDFEDILCFNFTEKNSLSL